MPSALRCVKHSVQSMFLLCSKSSEGSMSLTARHKVPILTHRPCVTTSFLQGLLILFFLIYYEKYLNILKNSIMNLIYPLPIRCSRCDHLADLASLQSFSCIVCVLLGMEPRALHQQVQRALNHFSLSLAPHIDFKFPLFCPHTRMSAL